MNMPTMDEALETLNRLDQLQHENQSLERPLGRVLIRLRKLEEVTGRVWKDADGNIRRIVDLDTSHLRNILQGRFTQKVETIRAIRKELKRRETSEQWRKKLQQEDECRSIKKHWPQRAGYVFCGETFDVAPKLFVGNIIETPRGQARIRKSGCESTTSATSSPWSAPTGTSCRATSSTPTTRSWKWSGVGATTTACPASRRRSSRGATASDSRTV